MKKVELLAPASSLEKAKIALLYGADAVYVGGRFFSLRARASNFSIEELNELAIFAHEMGKKVYQTLNIVPHEEDLNGLKEYLYQVKQAGVDAVIVSSPGVMNYIKDLGIDLEYHVSTQSSVSNAKAFKIFEDLGATRVVLARELSLKDIQKIKNQTSLELEVFIHGGMCSAISGRCVLSNHLAMRDANRGGCAHSCRWDYEVGDGPLFNMGSKDLCALSILDRLLEIGVASLKIEGRMKSAYYIAGVVSAYRKAIDAIYDNCFSEKLKTSLLADLARLDSRSTDLCFFRESFSKEFQLYDPLNNLELNQEFVALVKENEGTSLIIEERNHFEVGDTLIGFGPGGIEERIELNELETVDGEKIEIANIPLRLLKLNISSHLPPYSMLRKERK